MLKVLLMEVIVRESAELPALTRAPGHYYLGLCTSLSKHELSAFDRVPDGPEGLRSVRFQPAACRPGPGGNVPFASTGPFLGLLALGPGRTALMSDNVGQPQPAQLPNEARGRTIPSGQDNDQRRIRPGRTIRHNERRMK